MQVPLARLIIEFNPVSVFVISCEVFVRFSSSFLCLFLDKEINAKERDQFWIKEEQEEKNRVAAEKIRKDKV